VTEANETRIDLESLWRQLHDRLLGFICSRLPDCDEAEDILQDVFLRIHTNLNTVRNLDSLESWVYQIARNSITDFYRRRRPVALPEDLPSEDEGADSEPPEELGPTLLSVVDALPEPYRQAILLTDVQGLSQKDLSERLNLSFSGAKSRVQRARSLVRQIILACCHVEFDVRGSVCCFRERCACCCKEPILA
jgi:RNA polymerase sigma-70 factor (ECF subfamily)